MFLILVNYSIKLLKLYMFYFVDNFIQNLGKYFIFVDI